MNRVIKVFMERDGMTAEEAKKEFQAVREELHDAIICEDDPQSIEDLFSELTGLEPDYLFDVI